MDQLIVTKWKDRSLTALLSDGHCRSLTLESGDESLLGNIYIGKVKNVVKNINGIFQPGGKPGSALYRRAEPALFIRIFWKF